MVQAVSVAGEVSSVPFAHEVVGLAEPAMAMQNTLGLIPMSHGLILAGILFTIGLCGVMVRRNFLFMLMGSLKCGNKMVVGTGFPKTTHAFILDWVPLSELTKWWWNGQMEPLRFWKICR